MQRSIGKVEFEKLYEQTKVKAFYLIFSIIRNFEQAEELMDEAYLKALENMESFSSSPNQGGYIMLTAKNLALNHLARKKQMVFENLEDYENTLPCESDFEKVNLPVITIAKKHLKEDQFKILILCDVAGFKRREVAELMDLSVSGVTFKRKEALEKMKKVLEGELHE